MENGERDNIFKNLATLLSLLLPIAQVFAALLPAQSRKIILFSDQLLLISVFAAIVAYILIVAFRSTVWFSFTFQRKKKAEYDAQQLKINSGIYDDKELRRIVKNDEYKKAPYYITPLNVYYVLLPTILICLLVFVLLGSFFSGSKQHILIYLQAIIYILLVSLTSLTLGVFYINDINQKRRENFQKKSWENLGILLFTRQVLPEFPQIEFVAEFQVTVGTQARLRTIIRVDKQKYYAVDTDLETSKIFEISIYDPITKNTRPFEDHT